MPASASPGYKGASPRLLPPLQKPSPSLHCMHAYCYLFHPTRPPDMFAVYHPTRPPDHPQPGAMVQAFMATTPRVSPLLVCGACDAPQPVKLDTADAPFDDTLWRASLYPGQLPFVVASARQPGAHGRNTRPDRVLQSRRRSRYHLVPACTMPSRIRKSAQQYSCSSLFSLSFLLIRLVLSLCLGPSRDYSCAGTSAIAMFDRWICGLPAPRPPSGQPRGTRP
ncbi:hypothetical protein L227DRAFT_159221 [Lentinus tigrinus ALCF2SS1-6]|uniref:Uncharacterized protein n=1 Tax=Lentinus tigrinus ALCF2SS1-6 TaxID=1328759 RepID=A0A5C2S8A9_9APHY|nr:hypothetical protein L227DRAFT_159221 [Lentinus tigrinus ALCF2SS1-6]